MQELIDRALDAAERSGATYADIRLVERESESLTVKNGAMESAEAQRTACDGGGGSQRLTRLIGTHKSLVAILEGKPFTPAEALAIGAVDAVVPQDEVVARATELAEHFGTRSKGSVAAIKRAVYFGGSMSLTDGLHVERAEFLSRALSKDGQQLMLDYMESIDTTGELPLYSPGIYQRALESGTVPGARSANGALSRR